MWYDLSTGATELAIDWSERGDHFKLPGSLGLLPHTVEKLLRNDIVQITDIDELPAEFDSDRAALQAQGFRSAIILPLVVGDLVHGSSAYLQADEKRVWSEQEILDMQVFADLLANFLLRIRSLNALNDALAELQQATERLQAENIYLRQEIEVNAGFDEIIGQSPKLLHCLNQVAMVADTVTSVLILGETGTGKELIARAIHQHSSRRDRALVKVNCAALPASLIESELFGYEKGAFTGADRGKHGRFDLADGSTLFLDEIGDLPLELQGKLLRVLQEGEFERLGGSNTIKVDVRIVAATNHDLLRAVKNGEFRSDLYYRISTFPIELPPLRARGDDIQLLAEHFVKVQTQNPGRKIGAISADMMRHMRAYDWPGNIRELEGVVERAIISSSGPILELAGTLTRRTDETRAKLPQVLSTSFNGLRQIERDHIVETLQDTNWKISGSRGAAARLGIPASTLRSKMKKLGIERPG
jgi:transcriptional regulator with GAF, ATPase, and Fis domain